LYCNERGVERNIEVLVIIEEICMIAETFYDGKRKLTDILALMILRNLKNWF
jgi:hypothetical protein